MPSWGLKCQAAGSHLWKLIGRCLCPSRALLAAAKAGIEAASVLVTQHSWAKLGYDLRSVGTSNTANHCAMHHLLEPELQERQLIGMLDTLQKY